MNKEENKDNHKNYAFRHYNCRCALPTGKKSPKYIQEVSFVEKIPGARRFCSPIIDVNLFLN